jgi:hypothetical protein
MSPLRLDCLPQGSPTSWSPQSNYSSALPSPSKLQWTQQQQQQLQLQHSYLSQSRSQVQLPQLQHCVSTARLSMHSNPFRAFLDQRRWGVHWCGGAAWWAAACLVCVHNTWHWQVHALLGISCTTVLLAARQMLPRTWSHARADGTALVNRGTHVSMLAMKHSAISHQYIQ